MITQSINLNLIPGGVLPRINVSQYDKGSRTLIFNLYNRSTAFIIPGNSTITIQGTKADKTGFQYECTYSGSVVTADLEQQMTVFAGDVICELVITNSGNILGSANFVLNVEEAALADDVIISETELPLIEKASQAAEYAQDAEAYAAGTRDGVPVSPGDEAYHNNAKYYADNFNKILAPVETDPSASSKAYAVGQHFILDGELYKAKTPIAPGDALVLDTNYEAAESIEAQIETLDAENQTLTNNLSDEVKTRAKLGAHQLLDLSLENLKKSTSGGTWTDNVFTPSSSTAEGDLKFTLNSDSSIIGNGLAQEDCMLYLSLIGGNANISNIVDLDEDVILSGCPSGGSNNTYMIQWYSASTSSAIDYGSGVNVHPTNKTSYIRIIVKSGQSLNNLVFKPLIKLKSDPSSELTPYTMTNRELTDAFNTLSAKAVKTFIYSPSTDKTVKNNHYAAAKYIFDRISDGESALALVRFDGGYYDIMCVMRFDATHFYCFDAMHGSGFGSIIYFYYRGNNTYNDIFILGT